jgi:hypothetical protein
MMSAILYLLVLKMLNVFDKPRSFTNYAGYLELFMCNYEIKGHVTHFRKSAHVSDFISFSVKIMFMDNPG